MAHFRRLLERRGRTAIILATLASLLSAATALAGTGTTPWPRS